MIPCLSCTTTSRSHQFLRVPSSAVAHSRKGAAIACASHLCYDRRMTEVASRDLRNNTRSLLERVEAGEEVTITVDGRPVAVLHPVGRRPRWLGRDEFVRRIAPHQADPGLTRELEELSPDTTDDLP